MPHSPGSTGWRVTLPKYEDENREKMNKILYQTYLNQNYINASEIEEWDNDDDDRE